MPQWVLMGLPMDHIQTSSQMKVSADEAIVEIVDIMKRLSNGQRTGLMAKEQLLLAPYFPNHGLVLLKYALHRGERHGAAVGAKISSTESSAPPQMQPPSRKTMPMPSFGNFGNPRGSAREVTLSLPDEAPSQGNAPLANDANSGLWQHPPSQNNPLAAGPVPPGRLVPGMAGPPQDSVAVSRGSAGANPALLQSILRQGGKGGGFAASSNALALMQQGAAGLGQLPQAKTLKKGVKNKPGSAKAPSQQSIQNQQSQQSQQQQQQQQQQRPPQQPGGLQVGQQSQHSQQASGLWDTGALARPWQKGAGQSARPDLMGANMWGLPMGHAGSGSHGPAGYMMPPTQAMGPPPGLSNPQQMGLPAGLWYGPWGDGMGSGALPMPPSLVPPGLADVHDFWHLCDT